MLSSHASPLLEILLAYLHLAIIYSGIGLLYYMVHLSITPFISFATDNVDSIMPEAPCNSMATCCLAYIVVDMSTGDSAI